MTDKNSKNKSTLDKVIMGAIIGTAIGSAVGMTLAPKRGSEMREVAKETGTGVFNVAQKIFSRFFKKNKKGMNAKNMKSIPNEMEIISPSTSLPTKEQDHE